MSLPDRAAVSARLWEIAEHHIIAEWICCEPLEPRHDLCSWGYAALDMTKTLLVDADPEEAWNPAAPVLDAVMQLLDEARQTPPPVQICELPHQSTDEEDECERQRTAALVADRAAVYTEVADRLAADAEQGAKEGFTRIYRRSAAMQVREWGDELRRLTDAGSQEQP